jgi:DNA-binding CsgD family transcriptional regulator
MTEQIVGRQRELALTAGFLRELRSGPSVLLLEGEAGAGKTTIWNEAVLSARRQGLTVLCCRPSSSETKLSFSGLSDLLDGVIDKVLPSLAEPQRRALEVALVRAASTDMEGDGRTLTRAVLEAMRLLASPGPVVVAVDDVQWLDRPSTLILQYFIRRLSDEPIGLLLAWRGEADERAPLDIDRAPWPQRVQRWSLLPLTVGELFGVVQTHLGVSLPRPTLVRVHQAAGGNALFGLEIARTLVRVRPLVAQSGPLPIPPTLRELVQGRISRLPSTARDVLLYVVALSQPTAQLVEEAGPAGTAVGIDRALRAGVLACDRDRLVFTHPLFASVVYADATPRRRRAVHRRLAAVVKEAEERARHLGLGTEQPDAEVAVVIEVAAESALARGAPSAAAELYGEACRLTLSTDVALADQRRLRAAKCHVLAGDTGRGVDLAEQLVAEAPPGGIQTEALFLLGRLGATPDMAIGLLHRALEDAGNRPGLAAQIRTLLSTKHLGQWDLQAAAEQAVLAVALAEASGDEAVLNSALVASGRVEATLGGTEASAIIARAVSPDEHRHRTRTASLPSGWLGTILRWADDFDGARVRLEPLLTLATERGDESSIGELLYELGELECWAGNWGLALRYARESVMITSQTGRDWESAAALGVLASIEAHLGRVDEARSSAEVGLALARSLDAADETVRNLCALGLLELSLSQPTSALAHLNEIAEITAQLGDPGVIRYAGDHIEALIALGELAAAGARLEQLDQQGRRLDRVWALAVAARCRGLLLAARGDLDGATTALNEALRHHTRLPMPFEHGRTLLAIGTILRRAKRLTDARSALTESLSIFDRLGATLWLARTTSELGRIGGRRPAPGELTSTERRISELVACGRSNPEVAAALSMSRRTVEDHLSKIYRKIGVRSRTELAHRLTPG